MNGRVVKYASMVAQIRKLRLLDGSYEVFGARSHQYLSTQANAVEIQWMERELGTSLPEEYRNFLIEIGYGAGPYYGLWSPRQVLTEICDLCQEYGAETGVQVKPYASFPLTQQDLRIVNEKIRLEDEKPFAEKPWPSSGCIPICYHGCTFWSVLILQGEFIGCVWDVASYVAYEGLWVPAARPPGLCEFGTSSTKVLQPLRSPPTFDEWFHGWLERCLTDLRV